MDVFLSRHQCYFRKGYSKQPCLLAMLEKWRSTVDNNNNNNNDNNRKKTFGELLPNLSKAFEYLSHEFLLAKLNTYGLSIPTLRLLEQLFEKQKAKN